MQKVYFISGLAADKKIFSKLTLQNIEHHFLDWIIPLDKESIQDYAFRMSDGMEENATIIGVSFGGIMAHEISLIRNIKKVIIVSSIKSAKEKPAHFKLFGAFHLYKWMPVTMIKKMKWVAYFAFGTKAKEEKLLLSEIIQNSNNSILSWSTSALLKWNRKTTPKNLVQISGTDDRIFPIANLNPDYRVVNGSHFMIYSKPAELTLLLQKILDS